MIIVCRPSPRSLRQLGSSPSAPRAFVQGLRRAWTSPVSPRPLTWFRIALAGVLLAQALSLLGNLEDLFGRNGVVDTSVRWDDSLFGVPDLTYLDNVLGAAGLPTAWSVPLLFATYVVGLLGLLAGYRTRITAGLALLTHTALVTSSYMSCYGVDRFAQIGLFYCLCFPVGHALSLDRAAGRTKDEPTFAAWLGLRILQLHVCIIYTASGFEKASGEQWWTGEAIWRAAMGAPLGGPIDCSFLASVPWLAKDVCWMTLLLETGILLFVWHPRLRKLWLVGIVGMHLSIALLMNLWTFSATMIVFDVAAFGLCPRAGSRSDRACDIATAGRDTMLQPHAAEPVHAAPDVFIGSSP